MHGFIGSKEARPPRFFDFRCSYLAKTEEMTTDEELDNHLAPLVRRIEKLIARYLDAMELNVEEKDYAFAQRERDALVFNALAHTLTRLSKLNQIIEPETDNQHIHALLEQRVAKLVERATAQEIPKEPQS